MTLSVRWDLGGEATLLSAAGDHVTLRSDRAFPPGAPAAGTLLSDVPMALTVKVAGSRRGDDARFVVRGRLVSPTVALRATITGALQKSVT